MTARRGECDVCHYRWRLRKDGTLQAHHLYSGTERNDDPCEGSGQPPRPLQWNGSFPLCMDCIEHLERMGPMLAESIFSVAIETGGDPHQMYRRLFEEYHARDHHDPVDGYKED